MTGRRRCGRQFVVAVCWTRRDDDLLRCLDCRGARRGCHQSASLRTGPTARTTAERPSAGKERDPPSLSHRLSAAQRPRIRRLTGGEGIRIPFLTAGSGVAVLQFRIHLPPAESRANSEWPARHLNSWRHPGRGACCRDEVVAEGKIVYLRNVGQGSSGLEGEACSTLAMSSQRRSGTAPR